MDQQGVHMDVHNAGVFLSAKIRGFSFFSFLILSIPSVSFPLSFFSVQAPWSLPWFFLSFSSFPRGFAALEPNA
jgi:hypothetical protein